MFPLKRVRGEKASLCCNSLNGNSHLLPLDAQADRDLPVSVACRPVSVERPSAPLFCLLLSKKPELGRLRFFCSFQFLASLDSLAFVQPFRPKIPAFLWPRCRVARYARPYFLSASPVEKAKPRVNGSSSLCVSLICLPFCIPLSVHSDRMERANALFRCQAVVWPAQRKVLS